MPLTTAAQLQALATEINTDPRGYGYAADVTTGFDAGIADRLNALRDGSNPPTNPTAAGGRADGRIILPRGFIVAEELATAIVYAEYTGGQAAPRQYIDMLMGLNRIDLSPNSNPRLALEAIFPAGSQTRANIVTLAQKIASRAEELFGVGTRITDTDVQKALRPNG